MHHSIFSYKDSNKKRRTWQLQKIIVPVWWGWPTLNVWATIIYAPAHIWKRIDCGRHRNNRLLSIIISAIIQHFSFAKDVHIQLNAKLCPIYFPSINSSHIFINICKFNKFKFCPKLQFKSTSDELQFGHLRPINIWNNSAVKIKRF